MEFKLFINKLPKDAADIRYKVFTLEQGFAEEVDLDEHDNESIHILVYENNVPIATARMFKEGKDAYHVGRLAVLKEHRGKGVGSFILKVLLNKAKEQGATHLLVGSQIDKAEFYEKNGFIRFGDIFLDADYPHIMMRKDV